MELGEAVTTPGEFTNDVHTESTCPWHQKADSKKKKMEAMNPDEDVPGAIPPNDGGTLGKNMKAAKDNPPTADSVWVTYKMGEELKFKAGKKEKIVQVYKKAKGDVEEEYDLQYAPHHLIPGNESLKGSPIVPFMGDDDVIEEYSEGQSTHIKEGFSVGYDVNSSDNGVWLPSPYALSNSNEWPAAPGIKVIKKRLGVRQAEETEDFKIAYVAAAIHESGNRQFHMRHNVYSQKVQEILKAVAERMKLMAKGECKIASKSKQDGKFDPPMGLVSRMNLLSGNMRRFLIGNVWRDPLFTDSMTKEYADDLKKSKAKGIVEKVI